MAVRSPYLMRLAVLAGACGVIAVSALAEEPAAPSPSATVPPSAAQAPVSAPPPPSQPPVMARPSPLAAPAKATHDVPQFKAGLWSYKRTLQSGQTGTPQVSMIKKCVDPSEEMRTKLDSLTGKGCKFEAPLHSQNHYSSSWTCATPSGIVRFRDVLVVKDEASYEDRLEMRSSQQTSHQKIEATRIGECPDIGAGVPLRPSKRPPPIPHSS